MGAPASRRVWVKRSDHAVYVGTFTDPAGMTACVFADPRSGRALGPMNLSLPERGPRTFPAPRVGAPPDVRPGRVGLLEYYRVEFEGLRSGPDGFERRGVFLRFDEGPESRHLPTLAVDPFLIGLLGDAAKTGALRDPHEMGAAFWGLILGRHKEAAAALATRLGPEEPFPHSTAVTGLVFGGLAGLKASGFRWNQSLPVTDAIPREAAAELRLSPPGYLIRRETPPLEGFPEPDAAPFAKGPLDPIYLLRAAGVDAWRSLLRALPDARDSGEAVALGFDAKGGLWAAEDGKIRSFLWCSWGPRPGFGDVLRLQLQADRIGWAESLGRNAAAEVVDLLPAPLLARAAEEGHATWDAWERAAEGMDVRKAIATNPSPEHARRLERRLPGAGDARRKLGAVLAVVAAYWRAGAFDDARILLGRMPNLLPETLDAPVLRASKYLHALLEGSHVHDATEEARGELSSVWDGTLGPLAEELGQPFASRCAEVLDNAGL